MEMVFKVTAMAILGEHLSFLGYLPGMQKLYMLLNFFHYRDVSVKDLEG